MNRNSLPGRRIFIRQTGLVGITSLSMPFWLSKKFYMNDLNDHALKRGMRILFQGDSITDGNRSRNKDWNHVMGHGYAYLIASRLWYKQPDKKLAFYNRGISGNKITDLALRWKEDTIDLHPDILSILIGVNDVSSFISGDDRYSAGNFERDYDALILRTKKEMPEVSLVLCEPFILPVGNIKENWSIWHAEIVKRQEIVKKLAASYDAVFVSLQEPFDKACHRAPADYWIWDGVHPMPAGHELIARQWIKKAVRHISFLKI
jgi:lysophospholipase L1-like esterase